MEGRIPAGGVHQHFTSDGLMAIDFATGKELYRARVVVDLQTAQFTPDGRYLAWRYANSTGAMDMEKGELLFAEKQAGYGTSLMFTGDGRRLGYLERRADGEYLLVLRALAKTSSTTEARLTQPKGRVALNDLGDTGRYALLQEEKSRASQPGLLDPQLLLVETETGETVLRLPRDIVHAAVGSNDRVIATLSAMAPSAPEEDNTARDARELTFRFIDEDEPLLRADIPIRFERCVYLTEDLLAVCTAVDAQEQEALLFSLFNSEHRGEILRWAP